MAQAFTNGHRNRLRVAMFSPLPPAPTGTADYAAGLVGELRHRVDLDVYEKVPWFFRPSSYDVVVYQIANNQQHSEFISLATENPGVVVLHEVNLHDLTRGQTLEHGQSDAYDSEVLYELYGKDGSALKESLPPVTRPQNSQFTLIRRLLESSKGCIVHSSYAAQEVRTKGYSGPLAVIPHGCRLDCPDGQKFRDQLGAGPETFLVGVFGYRRPGKRIWDSLCGFRLLAKSQAEAKLLLVGRSHVEVPVEAWSRELGIEDRIIDVGFRTDDEFEGYLAACDVVLNLREPTYGESSGVMVRAMGMGRVVVASDIGSFAEVPNGTALKVPADKYAPQVVGDCLRWLAENRESAEEIGEQAREWIRATSGWSLAADGYASFLPAVASVSSDASSVSKLPDEGTYRPSIDDILDWCEDGSPGWSYANQHDHRLVQTLRFVPHGLGRRSVLELGCYMQLTPALGKALNYRTIRGAGLGPTGKTDHRVAISRSGERFACDIDLFDVERDAFPYENESIDCVLCCEILEHLKLDPMFMLLEIHRVLTRSGTLILTTPNAASAQSVENIMKGCHPGFYVTYQLPERANEAPRHAREYTTAEVSLLLEAAGFAAFRLTTGPYGTRDAKPPEWVRALLRKRGFPAELRGACTYAVARKSEAQQLRYPDWLYDTKTIDVQQSDCAS